MSLRNTPLLLVLVIAAMLGAASCLGVGSDRATMRDSLTLLRAQVDTLKAENVYLKRIIEHIDRSNASNGYSPSSAMVYSASYGDGWVAIRQSPSSKSPMLDRLVTGGDGADYISTDGNWYYVNYHGTVGYVYSPICIRY